MKPIKSQLPFLYPENAPVPSNLVDAAMLSVADSLADAWGSYDLEFDELCRGITQECGISRRATESAIREHIQKGRVSIKQGLKPESRFDPETGEFVGNYETEVFYVFGGDVLWAWQVELHKSKLEATRQGTTSGKRKPGRKSSADEDLRLYREFSAGVKKGEWKTQVSYLKKKHRKRYDSNPNAAKSWLSTLLTRASKLKESDDD